MLTCNWNILPDRCQCGRCSFSIPMPFFVRFWYKSLFSDPAIIIQSRSNNAEGYFDYYVHYEGYDRRLDEWVQRERWVFIWHCSLYYLLNDEREEKYEMHYKFSSNTVCSVCRVMMTQLSDQDWKEGKGCRAVNLLLDQTDRKITRNQKRKHCEIHHLQKASILPKLKSGKHDLAGMWSNSGIRLCWVTIH